jgi:hypothetical protein
LRVLFGEEYRLPPRVTIIPDVHGHERSPGSGNDRQVSGQRVLTVALRDGGERAENDETTAPLSPASGSVTINLESDVEVSDRTAQLNLDSDKLMLWSPSLPVCARSVINNRLVTKEVDSTNRLSDGPTNMVDLECHEKDLPPTSSTFLRHPSQGLGTGWWLTTSNENGSDPCPLSSLKLESTIAASSLPASARPIDETAVVMAVPAENATTTAPATLPSTTEYPSLHVGMTMGATSVKPRSAYAMRPRPLVSQPKNSPKFVQFQHSGRRFVRPNGQRDGRVPSPLSIKTSRAATISCIETIPQEQSPKN